MCLGQSINLLNHSVRHFEINKLCNYAHFHLLKQWGGFSNPRLTLCHCHSERLLFGRDVMNNCRYLDHLDTLTNTSD